MANLLSQEERAHLHREYVGRVAVVGLILACTAMTLAVVLTVPSYGVAWQKTHALAGAIARSEETGKQLGDEDLTAVVEDVKEKIALLLGRSASTTVHEMLLHVVKNNDAGIEISRLSYARGQGNEGAMTIIGTASTRESLILFTKRIEGERLFTSVHLPISDLASDKDVDFSLSVAGNF